MPWRTPRNLSRRRSSYGNPPRPYGENRRDSLRIGARRIAQRRVARQRLPFVANPWGQEADALRDVGLRHLTHYVYGSGSGAKKTQILQRKVYGVSVFRRQSTVTDLAFKGT